MKFNMLVDQIDRFKNEYNIQCVSTSVLQLKHLTVDYGTVASDGASLACQYHRAIYNLCFDLIPIVLDAFQLE